MRAADHALAQAVVGLLKSRGLSLATAESFTGGLLAHMITRVPGASAVFPMGWVTYAAEQKTRCLGVAVEIIEAAGLVSDQVAAAMAEGALAHAGTDLALATTGAAGPDSLEQPGHEPVPPGRVFVALAMVGRQTQVRGLDLPPPRDQVQRSAADAAFAMILEALS